MFTPELLSLPFAGIYFLDVVHDVDTHCTTLRFPAETSPIHVRRIVDHSRLELYKYGRSLGHDLTSASKKRHFRNLAVWTATEPKSTLEFVVEEAPQEHQLPFDPSSDVFCLSFHCSSASIPKNSSDADLYDPIRFLDTWRLRTLKRHKKKSPKWVLSDLFELPTRRARRTLASSLQRSRLSARCPSVSRSQLPSLSWPHTSRSSTPSVSTHTLASSPTVAWSRASTTLSTLSLSHAAGAAAASALPDILGDLRHVAIRWDPNVFSSYRCSRCLLEYDFATPTCEEDAEDDEVIPATCWCEGVVHDGHDFRPIVPPDVLDYWPDRLPCLSCVYVIVNNAAAARAPEKTYTGAGVFYGVDGMFYEMNGEDEDGAEVPTLCGENRGAPYRLAREVERQFAEVAEDRSIRQTPPRCRVLAAVPYAG